LIIRDADRAWLAVGAKPSRAATLSHTCDKCCAIRALSSLSPHSVVTCRCAGTTENVCAICAMWSARFFYRDDTLSTRTTRGEYIGVLRELSVSRAWLRSRRERFSDNFMLRIISNPWLTLEISWHESRFFRRAHFLSPFNRDIYIYIYMGYTRVRCIQ